MDPYVWVVVLFAVLDTSRAYSDSESFLTQNTYETPLPAAQCECSIIKTKLDQQELLVSKIWDLLQNFNPSALDMLEHRVTQLSDQMQNHPSTEPDQLKDRVPELFDQRQNETASLLAEHSAKLDQLGHRVSQVLDQLQNKSRLIDNGHTIESNQLEQRVLKMFEQLQKKMESTLNDHFAELNKVVKNNEHKETAKENLKPAVVETSTVSKNSLPIVNGVQSQYVNTQFGSNWIIILDNQSGGFYTTWTSYRNGFGTMGKSFWIGLENLHQLTKNAPYELAIEMADLKGGKRYARYDRFEIGSEDQRYPIVKLGKHSGTAGDGLSAHVNYGFSTYDKGTGSSCSNKYGHGGWWFFNGGSCYESSLTGNSNRDTWFGTVWGKFKTEERWTTLKCATMMIRAV